MPGPRLSLRNPLISLEQIQSTPSRRAGLSERVEREHRRLACRLAQSAAILLDLPQMTAATAQVLIQRFYYLSSLTQVGVLDLAMGAVFLASKVEETPKTITEIVNVFDYLEQSSRGGSYEPLMPHGDRYYTLREAMLAKEMEILVSLGFNVHVQLPYALLIHYLRLLSLESDEEVTQCAWSYLNDALQTDLYVSYQPPVLACMAIFLASRMKNAPLPTSPPWWELFDVAEEDMANASGRLMHLYREGEPAEFSLTAEELCKRHGL